MNWPSFEVGLIVGAAWAVLMTLAAVCWLIGTAVHPRRPKAPGPPAWCLEHGLAAQRAGRCVWCEARDAEDGLPR